MVVDDAVVQVVNLVAVDEVDGLLEVKGQHQMARQSVTAAAGDDTESRLRIDDGTRHLVHRAVTAYGDDRVNPFILALDCNLLGVSGILRFPDLVGKFLFVKNLLYECGDARFAGRTRGGVHDEYNSFHFVATLLQKYEFMFENLL